MEMTPEQEIAKQETPEPFTICDIGTANWYLKTLRNLENEKATIQAQTGAMLRALDVEMSRFRFRFEPQLQTWVQAELDRRGGQSKTLHLHQGTAAFHTVPASLRVLSPRAAMEYARERGWEVIKTAETLDAENYKKQAAAMRKETGDLIPGLEIVPERESFSIRFGTVKDGVSEQNAD